MTTVCTAGITRHPRSRLRARIVLAGWCACGLAALAWASFVQPVPGVIYNASDSVAVGWYRVDPPGWWADSLPVGSFVLTRLPADAAALAAQRGYLPMRVPLLKRVGAIAPQHVCVVDGGVRIDGRARGCRVACRPAGPAAVILAAMPAPSIWRIVPAEHDQPGVIRQPVFRADCRN